MRKRGRNKEKTRKNERENKEELELETDAQLFPVLPFNLTGLQRGTSPTLPLLTPSLNFCLM